MTKRQKKTAEETDGEKKEHKQSWQEKNATPEDIRQFLADNFVMHQNVVTGRVEFRVPPMDPMNPIAKMYYPTGALPFQEWVSATQWYELNDRFVNTIWGVMMTWKRTGKDDLKCILDSDFVPLYDPFRSYLESLPPWDGMSDAILELSETVRVVGKPYEQTLFYMYLKKWLVGMVASWLEDKIVNEEILVLVGPQGIYKSEWFSNLMPPQLEQYYHSNTNLKNMSNKDEIIKLSQYGLICCEEIDVLKSDEMNRLKWAVTTKITDERRAYARYNERRKHIASYCGTGNYIEFLNDETGNRRWLPFEVESIVSPFEHTIDHDAVFAQAYALYKDGFQHWFEQGKENDMLAEHNERFRVISFEEELIRKFYRPLKEGEKGTFVTSAEIYSQICGYLRGRSDFNPNKLGRLLSNLKFRPTKHCGRRGYWMYVYSGYELRDMQVMDTMDASS